MKCTEAPADVGQIIPPFRHELSAARDAAAMRETARRLAHDMSVAMAIDYDDAWQFLISIPDDKLQLLASPIGWGAISTFAARRFGLDAEPCFPTIH